MLPKGWSLISIGEEQTSRGFVNVIALTQPIARVVAENSLISLWAWDDVKTNWFFYAPSLEANGNLSCYITNNSYLDFNTKGKMLGQGIEFWVNSRRGCC